MDNRRGTPSGDGRGRGRGTGRSGGRGGDPRGERDGRGEAPRASRGGARVNSRDDRADPRGERRGGSGGERRGGFDGDRRRDDRRGAAGERSGGTRGREGAWGDARGGRERDRGGRDRDRGDRRDSGRRSRDAYADDVQTIGGLGDARGGVTGRRDGFRAARPGLTRARYGRSQDREATRERSVPPRGRDAAFSRDRASSGAGGFKGAAQPLRDEEIFPAGYTDERDTTEVPDGIRLQKVLAGAGVASRRACEEMIGEGRVTVDGQVVRRFGARVDPSRQVIRVDGKRIPTAPDLVYYAINKPIGVVSTMSDPEGRPSLADYVSDLPKRLFHVGRLDTETEGLIILTNDGELAHRLTHPSYGVQKKYWAKVPGPIPRDLARRLKQGVELDDGLAKADDFKVVQEHARQALVEIVLHEGRKHIVRRMMEEVGHRVIDLARIEFGPVKLGRLKPGTIRSLTVTEIGDLYAAVGL